MEVLNGVLDVLEVGKLLLIVHALFVEVFDLLSALVDEGVEALALDIDSKVLLVLEAKLLEVNLLLLALLLEFGNVEEVLFSILLGNKNARLQVVFLWIGRAVTISLSMLYLLS